MYFYVKDNQCIIGDHGEPKGTIGRRYYENDTKIKIYDNRNKANYFDGLITDLIKENDSSYADKADLAAAMPDFFFSIEEVESFWEAGSSGTHSIITKGNAASGGRAIGNYSVSMGFNADATNIAAHAEGQGTLASGYYAHAEGLNSDATGARSHAQGNQTVASGSESHSEGYQTIASGKSSHAQNHYCRAIGDYSHAGGYTAYVTGNYAFSHTYSSNSSNYYLNGYSSVILGGQDHKVVCTHSGIFAGKLNDVSGNYSAIICGESNTVTHIRSVILGGANITSDADDTAYTKNLKVLGNLKATGISEYADNATAITGGLAVGDFYRTGDLLKIVH